MVKANQAFSNKANIAIISFFFYFLCKPDYCFTVLDEELGRRISNKRYPHDVSMKCGCYCLTPYIHKRYSIPNSHGQNSMASISLIFGYNKKISLPRSKQFSSLILRAYTASILLYFPTYLSRVPFVAELFGNRNISKEIISFPKEKKENFFIKN